MPEVKLRLTIVIDIDAADYLEAADHQKKIEKHLTTLRIDYPSAAVAVRQRRKAPSLEFSGVETARQGAPWAGKSKLRVVSGRLSDYD
jgi:hypothetical protein